jgi:hypothetical protein
MSACRPVIRLRPLRPPPKRARRSPDCWGPPLEIKGAKRWRYDWHEEVLKRWDLGRADIAVAGVLMHAFGHKGWFAEVSLKQLAEKAGCSPRQAHRSTIRLREEGLVKVANEGARIGRASQETNKYVLIYRSRGVP